MKKPYLRLLGALIVTSISNQSFAAGDATAAKASDIVQVTATVQSVDVPNKKIIIKDDRGVEQTITIPDTITSLPKVKKGERVRLTYVQAVAADIKKSENKSVSFETKETSEVAQLGNQPGGTVQRLTKGTITIKTIDPEKNILTFVGPKGNVRTITVKKPDLQAYLKKLKPGDIVEVTYTEALVVELQHAKS